MSPRALDQEGAPPSHKKRVRAAGRAPEQVGSVNGVRLGRRLIPWGRSGSAPSPTSRPRGGLGCRRLYRTMKGLFMPVCPSKCRDPKMSFQEQGFERRDGEPPGQATPEKDPAQLQSRRGLPWTPQTRNRCPEARSAPSRPGSRRPASAAWCRRVEWPAGAPLPGLVGQMGRRRGQAGLGRGRAGSEGSPLRGGRGLALPRNTSLAAVICN